MDATVDAVCVVHEVVDGYYHPTAIDKRPVVGPVPVGEWGPEGDEHVDSAHGGADAAVYVYAAEDAAYFGRMLARDIPPGLFGDNVRTRGLDVTSSLIGERWWLGEPGRGVLLEVRKPRTPCHNLSMRMGIEASTLRSTAPAGSAPCAASWSRASSARATRSGSTMSRTTRSRSACW